MFPMAFKLFPHVFPLSRLTPHAPPCSKGRYDGAISEIAFAMTFELFSRRLTMGLLDDGLTKIKGPPRLTTTRPSFGPRGTTITKTGSESNGGHPEGTLW